MKKIILGFILGGIVFTLGGVVATTAISSTNVTYQNKTVNTALDELYNEAVTGKELVAAAITNKGVSTTSTDTYETMATNINNIDTDNSEINQKINNLESKHNNDVASVTNLLNNMSQSLTPVTLWSGSAVQTNGENTTIQLIDDYKNYEFIEVISSNSYDKFNINDRTVSYLSFYHSPTAYTASRLHFNGNTAILTNSVKGSNNQSFMIIKRIIGYKKQ